MTKKVGAGLACLTLALGLTACQPPPRIAEYNPYRSIPLDKVIGTKGLILAVARIVSCSTEGGEIPSKRYPGDKVRLFRLQVEFENVLQGDVVPGPGSIYYYMSVMGHLPGRAGPSIVNGCHQYGGVWAIGDRKLFLLERAAGVLRLVSDNYDRSAFPILTGRHRDLKVGADHPVSQAEVDLFLTKGDGCCTTHGMEQVLDYCQPAFLFSRDYAVERLEKLAADGTPEFREGACRILGAKGHPCERVAK